MSKFEFKCFNVAKPFVPRVVLRTTCRADDPRFITPTKDEIEGLLYRRSYIVVQKKDILKGAVILKSIIHNEIKQDEYGKEKFKSRLFIQGHRDPNKERTVAEAPSILRSSTRLILALSRIYEYNIWTRDVKQAFIQSQFPLGIPPFTEPPLISDIMKMMGNPKDSSLKALKSIYGLKESPGYWWQNYRQYHTIDLEMKQVALDTCLFIKLKDGIPIGLIGSLVYDALGTGNQEFIEFEAEKCQKFDVKERVKDFPIRFGGTRIGLESDCSSVNQHEYANSPKPLNTKSYRDRDFAHLRGQLGCIATSLRPDFAYIYATAAQTEAKEAEPEDVKNLNCAITHLQK